jgi:alpha-beta hydrolase superfamily lysophospholipase
VGRDFVEQGYIVYMIDQPTRGRSAAHPGDGPTRMFTPTNEEWQFTAIENEARWALGCGGDLQ